MIYEFAANEATTLEVLEYMKRVYGTQISGAPFTIYSLCNWIRIKKVPDAYGGNKILEVRRYKELGNLMVLTIEGWNRVEVQEAVALLSNCQSTKKSELSQNSKSNSTRPRKQRTRLYFQILEQNGKQYTKKTLNAATLPKYWKEAGIKRNQLVRKKV